VSRRVVTFAGPMIKFSMPNRPRLFKLATWQTRETWGKLSIRVETLSVKIQLKKESAKKYRRLWASRNDLALAQAYANHLIKKGWFEPEWTRRQRVYFQQQAYTTALVVSYARAFLDPKGWEQYLLKDLPYDEISAERLVLHDYLMKLRNQLFAHSDLRSVDVQPGRFPHKEFGEIPGEYRSTRNVTLTADQLQLLQDHAEDIIVDINGEMLITSVDSLGS
jgi:hypothetical protein